FAIVICSPHSQFSSEGKMPVCDSMSAIGGCPVTRKSLLWIFISAAILFAADQRSFDTWTQYLGGADSSQYSALKQINKSNVKQLQIAWTYQVGGTSLFFDPLVVDGTVYAIKVPAPGMSMIVALDGTTGKELWTHTN